MKLRYLPLAYYDEPGHPRALFWLGLFLCVLGDGWHLLVGASLVLLGTALWVLVHFEEVKE